MVTGSFASTAHGLPRATQDLDIVIDPTGKSLDALLSVLTSEVYYVDVDVARDAFRNHGMFNVIDHATGWKIDFILRKDRSFSEQEFKRRRSTNLLGVEVFMASAEDTIIAKLEWAGSGESDRQLRDVAYQATTTDFWGSMEAVGGPHTWVLGGAFNCGKAQPGQVAAVSHGCPSALFRGVRILNTSDEAAH
jgi:TldD protein